VVLPFVVSVMVVRDIGIIDIVMVGIVVVIEVAICRSTTSDECQCLSWKIQGHAILSAPTIDAKEAPKRAIVAIENCIVNET
jgi:hypothetical protein